MQIKDIAQNYWIWLSSYQLAKARKAPEIDEKT